MMPPMVDTFPTVRQVGVIASGQDCFAASTSLTFAATVGGGALPEVDAGWFVHALASSTKARPGTTVVAHRALRREGFLIVASRSSSNQGGGGSPYRPRAGCAGRLQNAEGQKTRQAKIEEDGAWARPTGSSGGSLASIHGSTWQPEGGSVTG